MKIKTLLNSGFTKEYYDNGNLRYSGYLKDGKMHGKWTFFRKDGSKMREGEFIDDKQTGIWRTYDRSENLVKETVFKK